MKKVLIWDDFPLKNMGGPMGYCFQIHEYLKEHPTEQITFLSDLLPENEKTVWDFDYVPSEHIGKKYDILKRLHIYKPYIFLADLKNSLRSFYFNRYRKGCKQIPTSIDLNKYDFIHFHWVWHLSMFKYAHPEYNGKLILTSHSPSPISEEVFANLEPWKKKLFWNIEFSNECKTYDKADYIIFPCEGAREPYEKYPKMKSTMHRNNHKFIYNPSAILDLQVDESKMQRYSELGIPSDAFAITYFGRHISVKGYDVLKQVGTALLDKYPNLYFLCAGRGEISPLQHPRWKELGFINNANELLSQSSLYILPNRETYFDLVTLEILRAGIPVLLSNTGGNRFFHHYRVDETMGMKFFDIDDIDSLITLVEEMIRIKMSDNSLYCRMKQANRVLFVNNFTIDKFVGRYIEAINSL